MNKTTIILTIVVAMMVFGCKNEQQAADKKTTAVKEIRVEIIEAKASKPEIVFNYSGIIIPYRNTPLSFQLPGRVESIYVDEGDVVRQGQILAELDKTTVESSRQMALATQQQAQDAYERLKKVYDKGSLPEIQWQEIKNKLQQANSALKIAEQNLKNTKITAPKNGVIGSRSVEAGSIVVPGISVFDLLNINNVYVRISVPENEIRKIQKEQSAKVSIPAVSAEAFNAKVEKIGVTANLISKTYEVKLAIDNRDLQIKPGMACNINISVGNGGNAISLPYRAVIQDSHNQNYVYKIEQISKKAKRQHVEVAEFFNNEVKIAEGVSIGDLVVVNGQHKLHDSADVIF